MINISILATLVGLLIRNVNHRTTLEVVIFYVLPIAFILLGDLLNTIRGVNFDSLGALSIFLPWLAALSIPFLASFHAEKYWNIYYRFVLIATVISLVEYLAIFSGFLTPTIIETDRGVFLKGLVSILHKLDDDTPHYRFYGIFKEPGTTSMFLLIALTYALHFAKRVASLVFIVALYLTDSLGGFFAFFLLMALYLYRQLASSHLSLPVKLVLPTLLVLVVSFFSVDYFVDRYEGKETSAYVREYNVEKFASNFGSTLIKYPLGMDFFGKSTSELMSNEEYYGSNLMFYDAFVKGGVLAFLGYLMLFFSACLFSIKYFLIKQNPDRILACAFIALPPLLTFVFQRTTIFESVVFAFLFATPLIHMIRAKNGGNSRPQPHECPKQG